MLLPRLGDDQIVTTARQCFPGKQLPYALDSASDVVNVYIQAAERFPRAFLGAFVWPDGTTALVAWPHGGSSSHLNDALIYFYKVARICLEQRHLEEAGLLGRA